LLAQDYPKNCYEIIIIDDGSNDATEETVRSEFSVHDNIRYIYKEKQGPAIGRNEAAAEAKGDILVFIDSDCIATVSFLKKISECLDKDPSVSAVGGEAIPVFERGIFATLTDYYKKCYETSPHKERTFSSLDFSTIFRSDCGAIKTDVFKALGGFDPKFPWAGEDHDMSMKILANGYKICKSPDVVVYHKQRKTVGALMSKYYECGKWDTVNLKDYFRNRLILALPFEKYCHFHRFPVTALLRFKTFETVNVIMVLCFLLPSAGIALLLLYLARGYFSPGPPSRSVGQFLLNKLHVYLVEGAFIAGTITGSIKNGVLYV
jgi:GT2 family glycosyltransferase